jgi:phosphatidylinositol alpha-mannosyltransferase
VRRLAAELRTVGDRVLTVGPGSLDGEHVDVGGAVGVPFNGSVAPLALLPGAARRTRAALRSWGPDVVHVHEPVVPAVGIAATRTSAPLVTTHHAWSERTGIYGVVGPALRHVVERAAARVAVSPAAADYHAAALGLSASSFRIVPNGVDVGRFAEASRLDRLRGDGPVLLFVGRLERRKGLEHAIRAFAHLKTHHPSLRMVVVGDGPERERCHALLPAGLRVDVDMLGRVSDEDLPRCYASADVFVAPATGGESFGIVLLEAMAAGTPVVASDLPGFRSVVEHGLTARLVPPGDARGLAHAVDLLLDNPALRDRQVAAGRQAVEEYDWPWVATRLRSIYRDVVETS